jgi:hypothetical protein
MRRRGSTVRRPHATTPAGTRWRVAARRCASPSRQPVCSVVSSRPGGSDAVCRRETKGGLSLSPRGQGDLVRAVSVVKQHMPMNVKRPRRLDVGAHAIERDSSARAGTLTPRPSAREPIASPFVVSFRGTLTLTTGWVKDASISEPTQSHRMLTVGGVDYDAQCPTS